MKDQEKLPVMNRPLSLACDNLNDTFLLDERALRPLIFFVDQLIRSVGHSMMMKFAGCV